MNDFDLAYDDDPAVFGAPYPALLDRLAALTPGRLLDLGCGQGRNAIPLATMGFSVTAVDASIVGVRQTVGATPEPGRVRGVVADLTENPIRGAFDVVLADMVLHGIEDAAVRQRLVCEIASAVEPGGTVVVIVPEPGALVDEIRAGLAPWPVTVTEIHHRLDTGEHRGDYSFTAVLATRTAP